jgi:hypothetical protein
VLGSLAGLGVLCTALAFVLFFQLIAEVGPARATVITYVNPAVAVALGVGVLGEPLTPAIVAAFVLILSGSVLATRSGLPRPRPAPDSRPPAPDPRPPAPDPRPPAPDPRPPAPDPRRPVPDPPARPLRSADQPTVPD